MNRDSTIRYAQIAGVQLREVDEDIFLIDARQGRIHHLNQLGAAIWRQLDEPITFAELMSLLCAAFPDIEPERLSADLQTLLSDLEGQNLIAAMPDG